MLTSVMKIGAWVVASIAALLIVSVVAIVIILQMTPVSLSFFEPLVAYSLKNNLAVRQIKITGTQLFWSREENIISLRVKQAVLDDSDHLRVQLDNLEIIPSLAALWQHGALVLSILRADSVEIVAASRRSFEAPSSLLVSDFGKKKDNYWLQYLTKIELRNIRLVSHGDDQKTAKQSRLIVLRESGALIGVIDLSYRHKKISSRIAGKVTMVPGQEGFMDLSLEQVNPESISAFSRYLSPLQALALPINARLKIDLGPDGKPLRGRMAFSVTRGEIKMSSSVLPVNIKRLVLKGDFRSRRFTFSDARIDIGGVGGKIAGRFEYELSEKGRLKDITAYIDAERVTADLPNLFKDLILARQVRGQFIYSIDEERLYIERLSIDHQYGSVESSGGILLSDRRPVFDVLVRFGSMLGQDAMHFWPLPIAPKIRDWVNKNITGGRLLSAELALRATLDELLNKKKNLPLREGALHFSLVFDRINIRFLRDMPMIVDTHATLALGGRHFRAETRGGKMKMGAGEDGNDLPPLKLGNGMFYLDDFYAAGIPAEISFDAAGPINGIFKHLRRPPLRLLSGINFNFDAIRGDAEGRINLSLPLLSKTGKRSVKFDVQARSLNLVLDEKLGPYQISQVQMAAHINNDGLTMQGRAAANKVPLGFEWRQPFTSGASGAAARSARLALVGDLTPQNFASLGQGWIGRRFKGRLMSNILLEGPLNKPSVIRFLGDITDAELMPIPLAYKKPVGDKGFIVAAIKNDYKGKSTKVRARLNVKNTELLVTEFELNAGQLDRLEMQSATFGRTRDLDIAINRQADGQQIMITGKQFDMTGLFSAGNKDVAYKKQRPEAFLGFLNKNFVAEIQIDRVVGAHDEKLDKVRLRAVNDNERFEKLTFDGAFSDGATVTARIERTDDVTRHFTIQTENASHLFRIFNLMDGLSGGSLLLQGAFYDTGQDLHGDPKQASGRFDMVEFRAHKTPTLAKILSLASFRGIADTLSGDGIQFKGGEFKFAVVDDLLRIKGGRLNGSAVGLTVQGDYNMVKGNLDFGGTLVPFYGLNSMFAKMPLIGRILAGREGEGVIGIGYRVFGESSDPTVLVNPLSVLTPGIFRRIFEIGIGLSPEKKQALPDDELLDDAKDKTKTDKAEEE